MIAALKTVLAAFFGVRSRKNAESAKLKPQQIIAAGLFLALCLALGVFLLVRVLIANS
ncbi:DUF2970 domain-containing protein [Iodobacter fluviatilis]|uniref:DUF2970 family protein n=1 Tax=Iodobacter fluviatilis TaxID=537 RepID=A0A377SUC5_9NEIS|nr:DUF2970 domain-containing protein [Iodobacter fluviatilis]TCU86166.1 DUF2970 family protein [Iodobacter fluviatilis]STR44577.1 Protein of uncharacterised function (DUF2970) [Iodobacter fluviatilis]